MNARLMTIVMIVATLPAVGGCGAARNLLFNPGAACGRCAATGPAYNVAPPAYGGPGYGDPGYGAPGYGTAGGGCGSPQCGSVYGGECGCGGETSGSYYGDYGYGGATYPGGTSIGAPMTGNGVYGGYPDNSYIPDSNWVPADPNMVPGSATFSDGISAGAMQPVPRNN